MTNPTHGETKSAGDKLKQVEELLAEYSKTKGLGFLQSQNLQEDELNRYLSVTNDELQRYTPTEAISIAYRLNVYALYIQHELNKEQAKQAWCNAAIQKAISAKLGMYDKYTKHEVKLALIAKEDIYVDSLQKLQMHTVLRTNTLTFISNSIKNLADVLRDYANIRSRENKLHNG